MESIKIRKVGNSLGSNYPQDLIQHMNVKEGDKIFYKKLEGGDVLLTAYDPEFEEVMKIHEESMRRHRNAYKELANR